MQDEFSFLDDLEKKKLLAAKTGKVNNNALPKNSIGQPVESQIDDYWAKDHPNGGVNDTDVVENADEGIMSNFVKGAVGGAAGVGTGLGRLGQIAFNTDGKMIDQAEQYLQEKTARGREWTWQDILSNPYEYFTSGSGASYGAGNLVGSMAAMTGLGAVAGAALPASVTAGTAGMLANAAGRLYKLTGGRIGMPIEKAAEFMNTPAGKAIVAEYMGRIIESGSEGGSAGAEKLQETGDINEARKTAAIDSIINMGILTGSGLVSAGNVAGMIGNKEKGRLARLLLGEALEGAQEGFEEGSQQTASEYSQGKAELKNFLPWNWSQSATDQAVETAIISPIIGGARTAAGKAANKLLGNQRTDEMTQAQYPEEPIENVQGEQDNQKQGTMRPIPIAEGIEDEGLANTNPTLRQGVDALNTWVYENFGKDMLVSGGARSEENNAAVNGSPTSHHLSGNAIDIDLSAFSEEERQAIMERAVAMGFNSDGEDMYHDKGTGLHMHLILPAEGGLNFNGMQYTYADTNEAQQGAENTEEATINSILDQMEQEQNQKPAEEVQTQQEAQENVQEEQDSRETSEEPAQSDIIDRILDKMQGKQILPEEGIPSIRRNGIGQARQGRTINIKNPLTTAEMDKILQADRVKGGQRVKGMVGDIRAQRAAAKQKALDYEWMRMEHEKNMQGYTDAEVRNNPSPSVQEAAQNQQMQAVTQRAMAGDHDAQRAFERYNPDVKAFLLQREMDKLNAQNVADSAEAQGQPTQGWLSNIYDNLDDKYGGNLFSEIKRRIAERRKARGITDENTNQQPQGGNQNPQPEQGQGKQGQGNQGEENEATVNNGEVRGNTVTIVTDKGTEIQAVYKLIDADSIVTSNKPNDTFAKNPAYPEELQPRDRATATMRQQVMKMAKTLRAADLGASRNLNAGAPIVNGKNIVLNGNGRAMAIYRALKGKNQPGKDYKAYMQEHAAEFGFTADQVKAIKNPILVREVGDNVNVEEIINSTAGGAKMGAREQAKADAKRITLETLNLYQPNDDADLTTAGNRDFVNEALTDITENDPNELNELVTADGKSISQAGIIRLKNALFAKAYNDDGIIATMSEATDSNIKNIINALSRSAAKIGAVKARAERGTGFDIDFTEPVLQACKKLMALRNEGKPVSVFLKEQSMFGEDMTDTAKKVLEFIDKNKQKPTKIVQMLDRMADQVSGLGNPNEQSLFGENQTPTVDEIVDNAIKYANGENQGSLFGGEETTETTAEETAETTTDDTTTNETTEETADDEQGSDVWGDNPFGGMDEIFGGNKNGNQSGKSGTNSGSNGSTKGGSKNGNKGGKRSAADAEKAERRKKKAQRLAELLKEKEKQGNNAKLNFKVGNTKARFDADIFAVGCDIAQDLLEDYPKYKDWAEAMLETFTEATDEKTAEKIKPFLGMLYKGVTSFPKGFKIDEKILSKLAPGVGKMYESGAKDYKSIVNAVEKKYGTNASIQYADYIKASFNGVEEFYKDTLNTVEEPTAEEPTENGNEGAPEEADNGGSDIIIQTTQEEIQKEKEKRKKKKAQNSSHMLALNTLKKLFEASNIKVVTDLESLIKACRENGMILVNAEEAVKDGEALIVRDGAGVGELYGMMDPRTGTMYLDPNCDLDTPIHEYTHLWNKTVKATNPKLWQRGVELAKQSPLWYQIATDPFYSRSTAGDPDKIADEVLARICGPEGERILQEMAIGENTPEGLIDKLKNWVKQFWQLLKKTFVHWGNDDVADMTEEEFAKMPLRALLDGVDVLKLREETEVGLYDPTKDDGLTREEAEKEAAKNQPKGDEEDDSSNAGGTSGRDNGSGETDNEDGQTNGTPRPAGGDGTGSGETQGTGSNGRGSNGIPGSGNAAGGEETVSQGKNGDAEDSTGTAGNTVDVAGDNPGFTGEPTVDEEGIDRTLGAVEEGQTYAEPEGLNEEEKEYRAALPNDEKGIFDKVVKKMPFLSLLQKGNLVAWIKRNVVGGENSLLLTDGTGTGKTYSGLATAKDVLSRKDARVLVVTPSQAICNQWLKAAKNDAHFNIQNAAILANMKDAGQEFEGKKGGLFITTYDNFKGNQAIFNKKWDLVMMDEGHHLSASGNGSTTRSLKTLRALTFHNRGLEERADILYATPEEKKAREAYVRAVSAAESYYTKLAGFENKRTKKKMAEYPSTIDFMQHAVYVEEADAVMPKTDYIVGLEADDKKLEIQGFYPWLDEQIKAGKINSKQKQALINKYSPMLTGAVNTWDTDGNVVTGVLADQIMKLYNEYEPLRQASKDIKEEHINEWKNMENKDKPKVLFLSATPFAYHFNTDYAEGYLFDYPADKGDAATTRLKFLHDTFGYELDKKGQLTGKFEKDADVSQMEIDFHEALRAAGALRGESLSIPADYNRGFIIAGSESQDGSELRSEGKAIGAVIDEALKALGDTEVVNGREEALYPDLQQCMSRAYSDDQMADLLEALKAKEAVRYAREYVKQGKKVVIIHRRKKADKIATPLHLPGAWKGGIFTQVPKDEKDALIQRIKDQYEKFLEKYPLYRPIEYVKTLPDAVQVGQSKTPAVPFKLYVIQKGKKNEQYICKFDKAKGTFVWDKQTEDYVTNNIGTLFSNIKTALATMEDEFKPGEALKFNGDVTRNKAKAQAVLDQFNKDDSNQDILIGQVDACVEGLNLHDTTGKKPRVLINITIPSKPSEFVQVEGRIYRWGTVTNAMFRYITTGTTMETRAWINKVAGKVATSENLAMGTRARGLLNSIREAFMETIESDAWKSHLPGAEGEDVGGKALDYRAQNESGYAMAKGDYTRSAKYSATQDKDGYYATPEPIGYKMVEWAGIKDGDRVLEPSAGHGAISRYFPQKNQRVILETNPTLATVAQFYTPDSTFIDGTFENYSTNVKFDNIVMTPPVNGNVGVEHVVKAYHQLRNGGRIVAMINDTPPQRAMLDAWLSGNGQQYFGNNDWFKEKSHENAYIRQAIKLPSTIFERSTGKKVKPLIIIIDRLDGKRKADEPKLLADIKPEGIAYNNNTLSIDQVFDAYEDAYDYLIPERFNIDDSKAKEMKKAKDWLLKKFAPLAEKYSQNYDASGKKMFEAVEEFIETVEGFSLDNQSYLGKSKNDPVGLLLFHANDVMQNKVGNAWYNFVAGKRKLVFNLLEGRFKTDEDIEQAKVQLLTSAQNFLRRYYADWLRKEYVEQETKRRKAVLEKAVTKARKDGKFVEESALRVAVSEKDGKFYVEPLIPVYNDYVPERAVMQAQSGYYGQSFDVRDIGNGVIEFAPKSSWMAKDVKNYVEQSFTRFYSSWLQSSEESDINGEARSKVIADVNKEFDKVPQYRFEPTGDAYADKVNEVKEVYFQKALKKSQEIANNDIVQQKFHAAIMATMNFSPDNIKLATEEVTKRRHEHPRLSKKLASSITQELVNEGTVSLVGRKVNNAQELAEYAQILRHPGYEKFHRIYVDKNGTIIDHDTVTSMMPDETTVYKDEKNAMYYTNKAERPEVDKVYYIHNHPSTDVTASDFDIKLTQYLAGRVQEKFAGHIILDTNMYGFLGPKNGVKSSEIIHDGQIHLSQHRIPKEAQVNYFTKTSSKISPLGKKVDGWTHAPTIAYWANKLDKSDGDIVAFLDNKFVCRAVVKLPTDVSKLSAPALNRYLRYLARRNYASTAIPITYDPKMYEKYKNMVRLGSGLVDAMLLPKEWKANGMTLDAHQKSAFHELKEKDDIAPQTFFGMERETLKGAHDTAVAYDGISFSNEKSLLGIEEAGGVMPWLKQQRRKLYIDWFDKNHALHDLDMAFSLGLDRELKENEKIYNKVQTLPASAAGMAQALVEGGDAHIHAINEKLDLKGDKALSLVTLKKVLNTINAQKMDKANPEFLAKYGKKNWVDAFSQYLGYERLLEMKRISEAEGKEYKLPKNLTEKQLKQYIDAAPDEFKKAATQYYLVNSNMLKLMEKAGLISEETRKLLSTKYKKYCPLMRDFSDTAAADTFIEGLTKGGRGIGNVSSMLKRISLDGSDRTVLSPIESTVKAIAVCANRCERNRVGQMAIKMVRDANGALDSVIRPVPGGKADPKNCVFTVMFDGKKQAYKTTQDLYSPIVGYNIPAAGMVLGLAKSCASLLRTGATTSPSFVLRNVIRDTIFAGTSSQNGFVPIYDTLKGAYALWKNPQARAEFEAGGVTGFNFYNSKASNYSDLLKLNGNKIDWHKPSAIWEALKLLGGKAEEVSAFFESATRMGEFLKAREKGKSIDEAVRAARELTLDFSRSGIVGQNVNQYIPFFNATLQGGDKMVRLFKDDPLGTATKLAEYIILPSLILWCFNHDEDWYKELDPWVKNTCWCLPGGIRIPKPQEAGITFGSGIEAMLDQATKRDPRAMANWIKEIRSNAIPNLIPTVFLPIIEWQANYSFFRNGTLVPKRLQGLPDEMQYTNHTATLSKGVGKLTGLSPVKIDNTVRGYTGTMGMFLWQMGDALEDRNEPAKKLSERQFFRDFNINDQHTMRFVNDFYELREAVNKEHAGYGVKGKPNADVVEIRKFGTIISGLNKDIQKITDSKTLSPAKKRELIDSKKNRIKAVAKKAVEKYGKKYL